MKRRSATGSDKEPSAHEGNATRNHSATAGIGSVMVAKFMDAVAPFSTRLASPGDAFAEHSTPIGKAKTAVHELLASLAEDSSRATRHSAASGRDSSASNKYSSAPG